MLVCGTKLFMQVVLSKGCARLNRELSPKGNVWNFPCCAAFVRTKGLDIVDAGLE